MWLVGMRPYSRRGCMYCRPAWPVSILDSNEISIERASSERRIRRRAKPRGQPSSHVRGRARLLGAAFGCIWREFNPSVDRSGSISRSHWFGRASDNARRLAPAGPCPAHFWHCSTLGRGPGRATVLHLFTRDLLTNGSILCISGWHSGLSHTFDGGRSGAKSEQRARGGGRRSESEVRK